MALPNTAATESSEQNFFSQTSRWDQYFSDTNMLLSEFELYLKFGQCCYKFGKEKSARLDHIYPQYVLKSKEMAEKATVVVDNSIIFI